MGEMGSLCRLLLSRVRGVVILILAGAGVLGCRSCPKGDLPPLQDASSQSQECYPAVEAATADGLAASLAASSSVPPACPRPLNVLALSGGVGGAPFTAGVLVGWSKAGTRPMFDVVSGISSGSLLGGYAFLGPKYDPELQRLILSLKTSDLFKLRPLSCMICDGAFGSAEPAKRLIRNVFNDEFVADVRQAHAEGRRFFVGTMSLQTKRL